MLCVCSRALLMHAQTSRRHAPRLDYSAMPAPLPEGGAKHMRQSLELLSARTRTMIGLRSRNVAFRLATSVRLSRSNYSAVLFVKRPALECVCVRVVV